MHCTLPTLASSCTPEGFSSGLSQNSALSSAAMANWNSPVERWRSEKGLCKTRSCSYKMLPLPLFLVRPSFPCDIITFPPL